MGLYLCVFEGDDEIEGVEVGSYSDFEWFRGLVAEKLEGGVVGSRFPVLMLHADSDGEWSINQCAGLRAELLEVSQEFRRLPACPFPSGWQKSVLRSLGLTPSSLYESIIDVDGECLLQRLVGLCDKALEKGQPVLFQ
jgi:hypothetical protein